MESLRLEQPAPPSAPDAPPLAPFAPHHVTVAGNQLTIFVESPPLFDALIADIAAARSRIWLEVYIFSNDAGGTRIARALAQKARAGLDVRVLYDAVGSIATPARFFSEMQAAGVQVHAFHTLWEGLRRFRPLTILNRRNHRKLIVIDDTIGYFGGMNLIDNIESHSPLKTATIPSSSGWRDVHVRFQGPQQPDLAESFDRSWRRAHDQRIPRRPRGYRRALLATAEESLRFFDSGWGLKYSRAARVYTALLRRARHSVFISMAYFVPVGQVYRALLRARRRRVRIRVVVPGLSDVPLVQRATTHIYAKLLRRRIRIYERQQRMLHSKVMVVDDQWTVLGSCNLDPRSLWINLEFLAVIRSRPLAELMRRVCQGEITASTRVRLADLPTHWWPKLLNTLAWSLRWWL